MARWITGRRRRLRRYYRRKYRRRYKRKVINLTSRSRITVRIPVTKTVSLVVPSGTKNSNVICFAPVIDFRAGEAAAGGTPARTCWDGHHLDGGLMYHPLYVNYANLYDEMKIDRMTVRGVIQTPVGAGQDFESVSVYTAWSRSADKNDFGNEYPTLATMRSMSTYQQAIAVNNTVNKFVRSLATSDLLEKISFIDASPWPNGTNAPTFQVSDGVTTLSVPANYVKPLVAWNGSNGLDPKFAPVFYFGITAGVTSSVDRTAVCQVQIMYTVTFRTPKFGASASASRDTIEPIDVRRQAISSDSSLMADGSNAAPVATASVVARANPAGMVRQDPIDSSDSARPARKVPKNG